MQGVDGSSPLLPTKHNLPLLRSVRSSDRFAILRNLRRRGRFYLRADEKGREIVYVKEGTFSSVRKTAFIVSVRSSDRFAILRNLRRRGRFYLRANEKGREIVYVKEGTFSSVRNISFNVRSGPRIALLICPVHSVGYPGDYFTQGRVYDHGLIHGNVRAAVITYLFGFMGCVVFYFACETGVHEVHQRLN
jgi:hypothetical protein